MTIEKGSFTEEDMLTTTDPLQALRLLLTACAGSLYEKPPEVIAAEHKPASPPDPWDAAELSELAS